MVLNVWAVLGSTEKTEMAQVLEPKLSNGTWIMRMSVTTITTKLLLGVKA